MISLSGLVDEAAIRVKRCASESADWTLEKRLQWLKFLDLMLAIGKDTILDTVAREKKEHEHQVLLNEYLVVRFLCKYYLQNGRKILSDENRSRFFSLNWGSKKVAVKKEPIGVAGIISPSNYPFSLPLGAVIPAILAGNGVLLKPAPENPITAALIQSLIAESLKEFGMESAFEILQGDSVMGQELVESRFVDKIHFTGSAKAGFQIAQLSAKIRLTPPTLELGGSNPAIVLADANLEMAARVIAWARFCGMSCNNIKRVFVVESVYKDFCDRIVRQAEKLQYFETPPLMPKEVQNYQRFVVDFIEQQGARVKDGLKPQVLLVEKPTDHLLVLREETFVPLLPVVKVKDEKEAIGWANQSRFGLGASVFTSDRKIFERVAGQLDCVTVSQNDAMTEFAQIQIPFGGRKESGFGYSHGPEGLLDFVQLKTVVSERWPAPKLQLYPWTELKRKLLKRLADWIVKFS